MYNSYLSLLKEFVSFKSISTDPQFQPEILKTVGWLKNKFKEHGFKVEIIKGYGNPLVLASQNLNEKFQTVIIYGHYDVQPASKDDGWKSEPFEVYADNKRIYARGVIDNKGQIAVHMANIFNLMKTKKLKFNVKFLIEGDEETGSAKIASFFTDNAKKLNADFIVISDGELTGKHACLDSSFRGVVNTTLEIMTSQKDNHSGLYGGSLPNSAEVLTSILAKFHDGEGNLTIKGINNPKTFNKKLLENNAGIPYSNKEFTRVTGAKKRFNDKKMDFYTQTGFLTSAEITTLNAGYQGEGYKNAIPGKAFAKVNFRLEPNLTVKEFVKIYKNYLKEVVPDYADYKVSFDQISDGFSVDTETQIAKKAKTLLKKVYKAEVYDRPCGAAIPIVGLFIKHLNVPVISVGLANEDCNMHAADENFKKDSIKKALKFSELFFSL